MLLLWDRTEITAKVRGFTALNASPIAVLTNKPAITSVADFGPQDRIAVPSVRISIQAVTLMAAAERAFGPGQAGRLDNLTVPMQHPDALTAPITPKSQIAGYVLSSPFQASIWRSRATTSRGLMKTILLRDDVRFGMDPVGAGPVAELMHRVGLLRRPIRGWQDCASSRPCRRRNGDVGRRYDLCSSGEAERHGPDAY